MFLNVINVVQAIVSLLFPFSQLFTVEINFFFFCCARSSSSSQVYFAVVSVVAGNFGFYCCTVDSVDMLANESQVGRSAATTAMRTLWKDGTMGVQLERTKISEMSKS